MKAKHQEVNFNGFKMTSASALTNARAHRIALLSVLGVTRNSYYNIFKLPSFKLSVVGSLKL